MAWNLIKRMIVKGIAPTNLVPAVAAKRGEQVLLIVIGRKGCVDG
jgi:hypothetical protein